MAQPTWVTDSGSLGTIPEGKFYRATLEAYDPDFPSDSSKVKYKKISGSLPEGIYINQNGTIEGTPKSYTFVEGVPTEVSENTTSKFGVRVYTEEIINGETVLDELNDRTFTLTITGQSKPVFETNAGLLGSYYDGQLVNKQIVVSDTDPDSELVVDLVGGELPPGVELNTDGLLYGYIKPVETITGLTIGFENEPFESAPLQFNNGTIAKTYQFTLRVSDGTDESLRTFSIKVDIVTADTDTVTVDSTELTVDSITRVPFIKNYIEDLGTYKHNNYFSLQFEGQDYNGDIVNYSSSGTLPTGLSLDTNSGFLYGNLSNIGLTEQEYTFSITVFKKENPLASNKFDYKIKIVGDIDTGITWNTNKLLGSIDNGEISDLYVKATSDSGANIQYRLKSGEYNRLPQGLSLSNTGNIIGRARFNTFRLVDYNTTIDSTNVTVDNTTLKADVNGVNVVTFDNKKTTFDSTYTFNVEAYNNAGTISSTKEFQINLVYVKPVPTQTLTVKSLLSDSDRTKIDELLENQDILTQELIYRSDDPYFGTADTVSFVQEYSLSPEIIEHYVESLEKHHYDKQLILGEIKTARALDDNGNIQYEVVYSDIVDNISEVERSVKTSVGNVYPNSLENMQEQIVDNIGQYNGVLPRWMLSKQENGKILGYTSAWVIAYTKPGQSNVIKYNIENQFSHKLNAIDFRIDRYILDSQMLRGWNKEKHSWYEYVETTFDIYEHSYSVDKTDITADTTSNTADQFDNTSTRTTFDKKSTKFIEVKQHSVDDIRISCDSTKLTTDGGYRDSKIYTKTDKFSQYLLFPDKNIINSK